MPKDYTETYEEQTISEKSVDSVQPIPTEAIPTTKHNTIPNIEDTTKEVIDKQRKGNWKPGQSGNPAGRPKGSTVTGRLKAILDHTDDATGKDGWELWAINLWRVLTTAPDSAAGIRDMLDVSRILMPYTDGRPESHQYVHRDTTQLYSVLQVALSSTDMPADARARLIERIEQLTGRTKQIAPSATTTQMISNETKDAKEDPK